MVNHGAKPLFLSGWYLHPALVAKGFFYRDYFLLFLHVLLWYNWTLTRFVCPGQESHCPLFWETGWWAWGKAAGLIAIAMASSKTQQQLLENFFFLATWSSFITHTQRTLALLQLLQLSIFASFGAWLVWKSCMTDITVYSETKAILKI